MSEKPDTIRIRHAKKEEWGTILELTLAAYAEFGEKMPAINWRGLRATIIKTLENPKGATVIVAESKGELLGSVLFFSADSNAYDGLIEKEEGKLPELRLLAVKPTARGQGVGTLLMNACIEQARQAGAPALGLRTSDSMDIAQPMYVRRGFVRVPERDFHVEGGENVEAYQLDLTDSA